MRKLLIAALTVSGLFAGANVFAADREEHKDKGEGWSGVLIDRRVLEEMSVRAAEEIERLRRELLELAGEEINLESGPQVARVLFERLREWTENDPTDLKTWADTGNSTATISGSFQFDELPPAGQTGRFYRVVIRY